MYLAAWSIGLHRHPFVNNVPEMLIDIFVEYLSCWFFLQTIECRRELIEARLPGNSPQDMVQQGFIIGYEAMDLEI
jgi:hypothetical protein